MLLDAQSGGAEKPTEKEINLTELEDFDEADLLDVSKESGNLSHKVNHLDERVTKVEQKSNISNLGRSFQIVVTSLEYMIFNFIDLCIKKEQKNYFSKSAFTILIPTCFNL